MVTILNKIFTDASSDRPPCLDTSGDASHVTNIQPGTTSLHDPRNQSNDGTGSECEVEFSTDSDGEATPSENSCDALEGSYSQPGPHSVSQAVDPETGMSRLVKGGPTNTTVFVDNLDVNITAAELRSTFASFGEVSDVNILPDESCAWIRFVGRDAAEAAMKQIQSFPIDFTELSSSKAQPTGIQKDTGVSAPRPDENAEESKIDSAEPSEGKRKVTTTTPSHTDQATKTALNLRLEVKTEADGDRLEKPRQRRDRAASMIRFHELVQQVVAKHEDQERNMKKVCIGQSETPSTARPKDYAALLSADTTQQDTTMKPTLDCTDPEKTPLKPSLSSIKSICIFGIPEPVTEETLRYFFNPYNRDLYLEQLPQGGHGQRYCIVHFKTDNNARSTIKSMGSPPDDYRHGVWHWDDISEGLYAWGLENEWIKDSGINGPSSRMRPLVLKTGMGVVGHEKLDRLRGRKAFSSDELFEQVEPDSKGSKTCLKKTGSSNASILSSKDGSSGTNTGRETTANQHVLDKHVEPVFSSEDVDKNESGSHNKSSHEPGPSLIQQVCDCIILLILLFILIMLCLAASIASYLIAFYVAAYIKVLLLKEFGSVESAVDGLIASIHSLAPKFLANISLQFRAFFSPYTDTAPAFGSLGAALLAFANDASAVGTALLQYSDAADRINGNLTVIGRCGIWTTASFDPLLQTAQSLQPAIKSFEVEMQHTGLFITVFARSFAGQLHSCMSQQQKSTPFWKRLLQRYSILDDECTSRYRQTLSESLMIWNDMLKDMERYASDLEQIMGRTDTHFGALAIASPMSDHDCSVEEILNFYAAGKDVRLTWNSLCFTYPMYSARKSLDKATALVKSGRVPVGQIWLRQSHVIVAAAGSWSKYQI